MTGIRFALLYSAITEQSDYTQEVEMKEEKKEGTHNVNVENPNVGKTTAAHRLQKNTMRKEYRDREAQRQ